MNEKIERFQNCMITRWQKQNGEYRIKQLVVRKQKRNYEFKKKNYKIYIEAKKLAGFKMSGFFL